MYVQNVKESHGWHEKDTNQTYREENHNEIKNIIDGHGHNTTLHITGKSLVNSKTQILKPLTMKRKEIVFF